MDTDTYNKIVKTIRSHKGLARNCFAILKQKYPEISKDTLFSNLILEHQRRMRINHIKSERMKNRYWRLYKIGINNNETPGIILRISEEYNVAPCLIAKLILQKYFEELGENVRDRSHLKINDYVRKPYLINDMHLSYEVFLCTMYDILYSPAAETMKHSLGQQYEIKLVTEISKLGLGFKDEEQLRKNGYDKTPDIKLEAPVAVDGFIVNWIESKALFGDENIHKEYMKSQYLSYWNRFGPGLVIYWFGYLESIIDLEDKRFIVSCSMPTENIEYITPPKSKVSASTCKISEYVP